MSSLSFLFVVTGGYGSEGAVTAAELARSALADGHRAQIFLAGDGVVHAAWLGEAAQLGDAAEVVLCDADLRWRSVPEDGLGRARRGSLRDLARACSSADRVLTFR